MLQRAGKNNLWENNLLTRVSSDIPTSMPPPPPTKHLRPGVVKLYIYKKLRRISFHKTYINVSQSVVIARYCTPTFFFIYLISKEDFQEAVTGRPGCSSSPILALACDEISTGLQRNEKNKDIAAYFSSSKCIHVKGLFYIIFSLFFW